MNRNIEVSVPFDVIVERYLKIANAQYYFRVKELALDAYDLPMVLVMQNRVGGLEFILQRPDGRNEKIVFLTWEVIFGLAEICQRFIMEGKPLADEERKELEALRQYKLTNEQKET